MKKISNQTIKIYFLIGVALLLLVGGSLIFYIWNNLKLNKEQILLEEVIDEGNLVARKLDGIMVDPRNENLLPIAIMIENHINSRPQSGLADSSVVYEVLTEASITRFLAIYDLSQNLKNIGPVRSARPYFIDIASEYGGVYVHSGGSLSALERLRYEKAVFDLNEFFGYNSGYFWRSEDRHSPHNLYTSADLLQEAKTNYQITENGSFESWKFKDGSKSKQASSTEISINYSVTPTHQVVWKYNVINNNYERSQNNSFHSDDQGKIIVADNLIVQFASTKVIDDVGRKDIKLIGEGKMIIFRDGEEINGLWKKESYTDRTRFFQDNEEVELNRGKTWIEIVPQNMEIVVSSIEK